MDGVEIDGRAPRAFGNDRHSGPLAVEGREKLFLEGVKHGAHVTHRTVAEKRHGAVGDLALRLDLRPPHAAMAETDTVLVERLRNDDVVDFRLREVTLARQIGDTAKAARFLIDGSRNLDRSGESGLTSMKASTAMMDAASPPFMSQAPRPKTLPSFTTPAKGSTVQPSPASTTSICELKCTVGPCDLPSNRATTLTRGKRSVSPGVPSARMNSMPKPRFFSRAAMYSAHGR